MRYITTDQISETFKAQLLKLWNQEYPAKLSYASIQGLENYLSGLKDAKHTLVLDKKENIRGWYVDFERDQERWFAIIVDSAFQGRGIGASLLSKGKSRHSKLSGWVIDHNNDKKQNGEVYRSPLQFYLNNGFELLHLTRLELEHLSAVKIRWKNK